jgi:ferredoxin
MKIIINRSLCDGNGLCVQQAPHLLTLDANDSPQALKESFEEEDLREAQLAVQACPKAALSISDQ